MKKSILLIVSFLYVFTSCSSSESIEELKASFSHQQKNVLVGVPVVFQNNSQGISDATYYHWSFGDGSESEEKNPIHTYKTIESKDFTVVLTIENGDKTDVVSEKIKVFYDNDIEERKSLQETLKEQQFLVCAHRGFHAYNPENSIASVQDAIDNGIAMIEIDVRASKDGHLVLMHDETIDRTTNGFGNVSDYTLEELQAFRLKNDNGILTQETIPTLHQVLNVARGKLYVDLDIDNKVSIKKIEPVIEQFSMSNQVLFYTKNIAEINTLLTTNHSALIMPNINNNADFLTYENSGIQIAHFTNTSFNQYLVNKAKNKGWYIFKNAYVNSDNSPQDDAYNEINKIVNLKGNIIQTDYPIQIKNYVEN